ncbi:MAG: hypothetical protein V7K89_01995 [Nostoc sp.]|uniref:hypothetical protein n=1 Tax=Nostoc sp. TaxID=1180 RepID=UPI002FF5BAF6
MVEVLNGGQIISTSSGSGRAGKITVNATDRVLVNGTDAEFNERLDKFLQDLLILALVVAFLCLLPVPVLQVISK